MFNGQFNLLFFIINGHPEEMGESEIESFLNHLVVNRNVAKNTQKTALNSLVFLYKRFLKRELINLQIRKYCKVLTGTSISIIV